MPVEPHRFLSLGCLTSLAGKPGKIKMACAARRRKRLVLKNPEEKGVVNSKLLPVTRAAAR